MDCNDEMELYNTEIEQSHEMEDAQIPIQDSLEKAEEHYEQG